MLSQPPSSQGPAPSFLCCRQDTPFPFKLVIFYVMPMFRKRTSGWCGPLEFCSWFSLFLVSCSVSLFQQVAMSCGIPVLLFPSHPISLCYIVLWRWGDSRCPSDMSLRPHICPVSRLASATFTFAPSPTPYCTKKRALEVVYTKGPPTMAPSSNSRFTKRSILALASLALSLCWSHHTASPLTAPAWHWVSRCWSSTCYRMGMRPFSKVLNLRYISSLRRSACYHRWFLPSLYIDLLLPRPI